MKGRRIVITGGNGAIAIHLAGRLLDEGAEVTLWIHDARDRADSLADRHPVAVIVSDLCDHDASRNAWDAYRSKNPAPQALIHTAALRAYDHTSLRNGDPRIWKEVMETNLLTAANTLRILIPDLAAADPGRIVLFGSDVSRNGLQQGSAYAAAKAGIVALARSVALEEPGILVNVVSPGPVLTDYRSDSEDYLEFRRRYFEEEMKQVPLGRLATPDDLYGLVRHLISDGNRFLTGEEIFLTGGKR